LRKNPFSYVVGAASPKGIVSIFSPNSQEPLLKILAHNGVVNSIDFSRDGNYMLTCGSDSQFKVFDIRKSFAELYSYYTPKEGTNVRFSQTGIAAVSCGSSLVFWKDCYLSKQKSPFFKHENIQRKHITATSFVPYEDFMGVCYNGQFESIFVPSSGAQDYDTFEDNLNPERRQNREMIVQKLLDKVF
jgi:U3 small nucleolar RNA-associated protein 7